MQPNKQAIRQLVDALRSGRYKQVKDALRIDDSYCCLGVACDISGLGEWKGTNIYDDDGRFVETQWSYRLPNGVAHSSVLPPPVAYYYGFESVNPLLSDEFGNMYEASAFNDQKDYDFNKIADLFEREYLSGTE